MKLHLYGLPENPKMLLIHGVLMPWQIWEPQIQYYKEKYHVLVVELDGHTQDKPSRFVSAEMQVFCCGLRFVHWWGNCSDFMEKSKTSY